MSLQSDQRYVMYTFSTTIQRMIHITVDVHSYKWIVAIPSTVDLLTIHQGRDVVFSDSHAAIQ